MAQILQKQWSANLGATINLVMMDWRRLGADDSVRNVSVA